MLSNLLRIALFFVALALGAGCSQRESVKSDAAKTPAKEAAKTPVAPPAVKAGLAPVDPKRLEELLPESLPGLPRQKIGSDFGMSGGFKTSKAKAAYSADTKSLEISILDFAETKEKIEAGYGWAAGEEVNQKSAEGYEKTGYLKNIFKTYEKYDEASHAGQLLVYVGGRFIVSGTSQNVELEAVRAALEKLDLKKLATLK